MPHVYVRLGNRVKKPFKDDRSGIYLPTLDSTAKLEDYLLNERILTAINHSILVQIPAEEYNLLNDLNNQQTSDSLIFTSATLNNFDEAQIFKDVIGPIDAPPNGGTTSGNSYLIGNNPIDEWKGRSGYIASWDNGTWKYTSPDDASVALLKLYPGYFFFYSGEFPNGSWRKYPSDPINIQTINDLTGAIGENTQQQIVNNFFTNYYNSATSTNLKPARQFKTVGEMSKYVIPTSDTITDIMVIVESQLMYELEGVGWGYKFDRPSKTIYFNYPIADDNKVYILYY